MRAGDAPAVVAKTIVVAANRRKPGCATHAGSSGPGRTLRRIAPRGSRRADPQADRMAVDDVEIVPPPNRYTSLGSSAPPRRARRCAGSSEREESMMARYGKSTKRTLRRIVETSGRRFQDRRRERLGIATLMPTPG